MITAEGVVNLLADVVAHELQDKVGLEAPARLQARVRLAEALDAWRAQAPWPTHRESPFERARRDPVFHGLVRLLQSVIADGEGQYTPTEVREACMVAQTILEEQRADVPRLDRPIPEGVARIAAHQAVSEVDAQVKAELAKKLRMSLSEFINHPDPSVRLSVRWGMHLHRAGIRSLGDLVIKTDLELLRMRGFGITSLREVERKLAHLGLRLGMVTAEAPPQVDAADKGDQRCQT